MDYNDYKYIIVERKESILSLTLNRPESLNAVNSGMHEELATIFSDIRNDPEAEVVTITGAGRGFCAGADRNQPAGAKEEIDKLFFEARKIVVDILELDLPIISAVNGPAAGLGVTLALFADIVIASDRARLGDTHVKIGVSAGDGGAVIWPILVTRPRSS
jgi:enoyl-CoA hydratase